MDERLITIIGVGGTPQFHCSEILEKRKYTQNVLDMDLLTQEIGTFYPVPGRLYPDSIYW